MLHLQVLHCIQNNKIPVSHHSSLIWCVLNKLAASVFIPLTHQIKCMRVIYAYMSAFLCVDAYERSSSPPDLSAWISVCFWHTTLLPWVSANFVVAVIGHLNLKCHFLFCRPEGTWVKLWSIEKSRQYIFMMSQSRQDKRWLYSLELGIVSFLWNTGTCLLFFSLFLGGGFVLQCAGTS